MAITDCRVWGVSEAEYDAVQLAGNYVVRFQVIANAVHGAKQLIDLCQTTVNPVALDPALMRLPLKWATYDYREALGNEAEVDRASFAKRFEARLRDVESGFYNWWIDVVYERLQPGELPPLDNDGNLHEDPINWPIVYSLQTFTIAEVVDKGIPKDAQVRDKTIPDLGSNPQTGEPWSHVENFEDLPESDTVLGDPFIPITNQAGTPPSVYKRVNLNRPLLVARAYVRDLYTFYKDIARAKKTANKNTFFGQKPGYACFKDGRIIGGRRYDVQGNGVTVQQFYVVEYRWELWGNVSDVSPATFVLTTEVQEQTIDSKDIPCAEVQVVNEGFYAWSEAAPAGTLQPIAETDSAGNKSLVTDPWPLASDGTAKAAADADTYDVYGWWFLLPYDYTKMAGGKIASTWPRYDYVEHAERQ